jgi:hypothetical protein
MRAPPRALLLIAMCGVKPLWAAETIAFNSDDKVLHGLFYKPAGAGPFPALLYNHGSSPGLLNNWISD